jgi:hypothetical protein
MTRFQGEVSVPRVTETSLCYRDIRADASVTGLQFPPQPMPNLLNGTRQFFNAVLASHHSRYLGIGLIPRQQGEFSVTGSPKRWTCYRDLALLGRYHGRGLTTVLKKWCP